MPDLYLRIAEQPDDVLEQIARAMDKRAAEPAMQRIAARYLGALERRCGQLLEIGCGNGASTGLLLEHLEPTRFVGIDPSTGLIDRAKRTHGARPCVTFEVADAIATGQPDAAFDAVVAHTVFSHLADPEGALAEAFRVLRPGGRLAVFDGDYATNTVALFDGDPLQAAMTLAQRNLIHDPYIMRRLAGMARRAGFTVREIEAHGYVQTEPPGLPAQPARARHRCGRAERRVRPGPRPRPRARGSAPRRRGLVLRCHPVRQPDRREARRLILSRRPPRLSPRHFGSRPRSPRGSASARWCR